MNVSLSWDLFVVVFFVVITAYSFIIGTNSTLKVILSTYVAAIAADATGVMLSKGLDGSELFASLLDFASVNNGEESVVFVKVLVFVGLVILLSVKGDFEIAIAEDRSWIIRTIINAIYAVMSAGLVISVILVFVSGVSFVSLSDPEAARAALQALSNQSEIIASMIRGTYLWFALPALAFVVHSFYRGSKE